MHFHPLTVVLLIQAHLGLELGKRGYKQMWRFNLASEVVWLLYAVLAVRDPILALIAIRYIVGYRHFLVRAPTMAVDAQRVPPGVIGPGRHRTALRMDYSPSFVVAGAVVVVSIGAWLNYTAWTR